MAIWIVWVRDNVGTIRWSLFLHEGDFYIKIFLFCNEVLSAKENKHLSCSFKVFLPHCISSFDENLPILIFFLKDCLSLISSTSQCFQKLVKREQRLKKVFNKTNFDVEWLDRFPFFVAASIIVKKKRNIS